jgi:hypothetical protein
MGLPTRRADGTDISAYEITQLHMAGNVFSAIVQQSNKRPGGTVFQNWERMTPTERESAVSDVMGMFRNMPVLWKRDPGPINHMAEAWVQLGHIAAVGEERLAHAFQGMLTSGKAPAGVPAEVASAFRGLAEYSRAFFVQMAPLTQAVNWLDRLRQEPFQPAL